MRRRVAEKVLTLAYDRPGYGGATLDRAVRTSWGRLKGRDGKGRRRRQRARQRDARAEYLASKPRCWCGRVGVLSCWAFFPDTGESKREWACRRHVEPVEGMDEPDLEPCMCEWEGGCGGLGVVYCRGCGGDNCVCICGGGPVECEGCEDCGPLVDDCDDFYEDEEAAGGEPA